MQREEIVDKENDILGGWNSEPEVGELIASLIKLHQCKSALEIGVYKGFTSLSILDALPEDGYYEGIDIEDYRPELVKKSMKKKGYFIKKNSLDYLPTCTEKFDLIFIDGVHEFGHVIKEFKLCENLISKGGLICFHDSIHIEGIKKVIDYIKSFSHFEVITLNTSENRGISIVKCL